MANHNPRDYFRNGTVYVWKETFAVVKAKRPLSGSFAIVHDRKETNEITAVIDQTKLEAHKEDIIEFDGDWKIITFDMILPLDMVGWLAEITDEFAEEGISILVLSSYSTDHVLVQTYDLEKAIKKLKSLGSRVTEK